MTRATPAVEMAPPPPGAPFRVINPVMRRTLESRFHRPLSGQLVVLAWTGRRSGRTFSTPVGYHEVDGVTYLLTRSPWHHNFEGGRQVEVVLRGRRRTATATRVDDPDLKTEVYARVLERVGGHRKAARVGLRVNVGREPTRDELREGLALNALIRLDLDPA